MSAGKIESGRWLIWISIYFFLFFVVTYCVIGASAQFTDMDVTGITTSGGSYSSHAVSDVTPDTVNPSDTITFSAFKDTFGFILGFHAAVGLTGIGLYIFSFLFFWLPLVAWFLALYFALPVVN